MEQLILLCVVATGVLLYANARLLEMKLDEILAELRKANGEKVKWSEADPDENV